MKNYDLKIINHENVDRIQISFDGGEKVSIPVADIQAAIEQHKQQPVQKKRVMKRGVISDQTFKSEYEGKFID